LLDCSLDLGADRTHGCLQVAICSAPKFCGRYSSQIRWKIDLFVPGMNNVCPLAAKGSHEEPKLKNHVISRAVPGLATLVDKIVGSQDQDCEVEFIRGARERFERAIGEPEDPLMPDGAFGVVVKAKLDVFGNRQSFHG
jgi:hypothetical protein